MIQQLSVSNYVLIKSLEFDFSSKLMVVTGETGAGKSIFIHALSLLLGQRLNKDIVGPYDDKAIIEGIFKFEQDSTAYQTLVEAGFDCDDEMIFTRQIDSTGRSTYRIDRQLVPLTLVKECLSDEIDIHSQFNTQGLLNENNHLSYLDQLIDQPELFERVADLYKKFKKNVADKEEFISHQLDPLEVEQLNQEIVRLQDLNLSIDEEQRISQEVLDMSQLQSSLKQFNNLVEVLDNLNYESLYTHLNQSGDQEIDDLVSSAYYQLSEAHQSINKHLRLTSFDEAEYQQLNQRIFVYTSTQRRLNKSTQEILNYIDDSLNLISDQQDYSKTIERFDRRIEESFQEYLKGARQLSKVRLETAEILKEQLKAHVIDLNIKQFDFKVEFISDESSRGLERARFLVSMNKGQALAPLASVASGGELSRVMLALKIIFNAQQTQKLIVFDEIDSGVSGNVAFLMGQKMKAFSEHHTLLVVTHLPIIAAFGDSHHLVYKNDDSKYTEVFFKKLNETQKIEQLALMLSSTINDKSKQAAQDLIDQTRGLN